MGLCIHLSPQHLLDHVSLPRCSTPSHLLDNHQWVCLPANNLNQNYQAYRPFNPIAPYSIACGVLAWPDRFSYCAACLGWSNWSTEYTLNPAILILQNLLYKICSNSISMNLIFCMYYFRYKVHNYRKRTWEHHNATEIIRKLALAIDARSDTCENDLY